MKVFGCVIGILGILLCAVSATVFGVAISRAMKARAVATLPLEFGSKLESDPVKVDTSKFCMIALKAKISSTETKTEAGKTGEYDLRFSFPFQYKVVDAAGKTLVTQDTSFSDDAGARTLTNEQVTSAGGTVEVETGYDKFAVPAPGEIRIEAEIHVDEKYRADAGGLELIVYDHVSKHAKSVATGAILLVLGGGMAFVGLVLFIVGAVRKSETRPPQPPQFPAA